MGADARWVCHECKTVCSRGGRPIITRAGNDICEAEIDGIKESIASLRTMIDIEDDRYQSWIEFLDDLRTWVSRHGTHDIHIGSDYSTDMMELDDYRDETVEGKVSKLTRFESRCKGIEQWQETTIRQIQQVVGEHGLEIEQGNTRSVAEELYRRFSTGCM